MLKVFTTPMRVQTPNGAVFARFAMVPKQKGEPLWVMYRGECGGWFTTMLDGAQLPA